MPIYTLDSDSLTQVCAGCGAMHVVPIAHASIKARRGPYASLVPDDTLEVVIDDAARPVTVTLNTAERADASALATATIVSEFGAALDADHGALRIVSRTRGLVRSSLRVVGGTACSKLGLDDRLHRPLCLGVTKGTGHHQLVAPDTIELPHCPDCGAKECLVRTWDSAGVASRANNLFQHHRRAVNALSLYLERLGSVDAPPHRRSTATAQSPPDIEPDFPARPIDLARFYSPRSR